METQIYNRGELNSTFAFRAASNHDVETLGRLLDDPDIHLQSPFQRIREYEYQGQVMVGAESIALTFHHKGQDKAYRLSALRCSDGASVAAVRLLRQVVFQNARRNDLGIQVNRPAFRAQPEQLQVRIGATSRGKRDGKSTSGTSHQESVGYWGERHVVCYLEQHFPRAAIKWCNADEEQGLPYDLLLDGRLAFDVKATRIERSYVDLSEAEGRFRRTVGRHHAVAVVTLGDDKKAPPLALDLYSGVPLVRSDLDTVRQLLAELPVLQDTTAAELAPTTDPIPTPAYFMPGRYVSAASTLLFRPEGQFEESGRAGLSGHYGIAGHFVVLHRHGGHLLDRLHIVTDGDDRQLVTPDGNVYLLQVQEA